MTKQQKSWEKRLSGGPDETAMRYVESLSYDRRLYKYDIVGSIAHAEMLKKQKLITADEFDQIKKALLEISEEISSGKFQFDIAQEDIHMAIEAALVERIGDPGRKLHTGRSRNDQVATDIRLWMRDAIEDLQSRVKVLQKAFVQRAKKYSDDIMPAYTHLQRAQPITIGAYLMSFVEQLARDFMRLTNTHDMLDSSPLGSGAIAGSTLPIDRQKTAKLLGFCSVSRNSLDSVSDRDFCAEFIFDCSLIAAHLSRLAEDWIIYSTTEFDFVKISDAYCTSSSMMPQKRNPDMLELMRGKTGTVYGSLMAMLTILKAQPSGYNRDLQEDKLHVFAANDTVTASLEIAAGIVSNTDFNVEKIKDGIDSGYLDATSLAEYLVSKSVPFRQAHGIVGALVAYAEKKKSELADLSLDQFRTFSTAIEDDVYNYLGAENVVAKYVTEGSGGSEQVKAQIEFWQQKLSK